MTKLAGDMNELASLVRILTQALKTMNTDGGPGSGDWGHVGRPGKVGGSGGGGGKANRTGTRETGFSSEAKKRFAEKKAKQAEKREPQKQQLSKKSSTEYEVEAVERKSFDDMTKISVDSGDLDVRSVYIYLTNDLEGLPVGSNKWHNKVDAFMRSTHTKKFQKQYGDVKGYIEKHLDEYKSKLRSELEEKMSMFKDGDLGAEYNSKVVGKMQKTYDSTIAKYSDYDGVSPKEFYDLQKKTMEGMTTEDFAILEKSYYHGEKAYGSDYTTYSTARIQGTELNWAQKRLEQVVAEHSVEIPAGKTIFRKTKEEEFVALTGKTLAEFDNDAPASSRTAIINKVTSAGTALQYDGFQASNVLIEYHCKKGSKIFATTNTDEAELLFSRGTRISNIKVVRDGSQGNVPSIFREGVGNKSNAVSVGQNGRKCAMAKYTDGSTSIKKFQEYKNEGCYDFTYSGKGSYNAYYSSRIKAFSRVYFDVNKLTRVIVEVE